MKTGYIIAMIMDENPKARRKTGPRFNWQEEEKVLNYKDAGQL